MQLQLRLYRIRVGDFPAVLELLRDIKKFLRFRSCALRDSVFALGDNKSVIGLGHCDR